MESKQVLQREGSGKNIREKKLLFPGFCNTWCSPLLQQSQHCKQGSYKHSAFSIIATPALIPASLSQIFHLICLLTILTYFQMRPCFKFTAKFFLCSRVFGLHCWIFPCSYSLCQESKQVSRRLLITTIVMDVVHILNFKCMTEACMEWRYFHTRITFFFPRALLFALYKKRLCK